MLWNNGTTKFLFMEFSVLSMLKLGKNGIKDTVAVIKPYV